MKKAVMIKILLRTAKMDQTITTICGTLGKKTFSLFIVCKRLKMQDFKLRIVEIPRSVRGFMSIPRMTVSVSNIVSKPPVVAVVVRDIRRSMI